MKKKHLPIIPSERSDDLHNLKIANNADLVLFMAGNQFMVMDEIISIFQKKYPDIKRIFYPDISPQRHTPVPSSGATGQAENTE